MTRDPVRPRTCPLAAARAASTWLDQVSAAYAVMHDTHGGVSFTQITGREPHAWDVAALARTTQIRLDVQRSDAAIEKREKAEKDAREGKG